MLMSFSATEGFLSVELLTGLRHLRLLGGYVVKYEGDAVVFPHVHDAVLLLIIEFIGLTYLKLVRPAVNYETHGLVCRDRHMHPVTHMEGAQLVAMREYATTGNEFCRHGT